MKLRRREPCWILKIRDGIHEREFPVLEDVLQSVDVDPAVQERDLDNFDLVVPQERNGRNP